MFRFLLILPLCFAIVDANAALVDPLHKDPIEASNCPLHETDLDLPYCVVPDNLRGEEAELDKSIEHLKKEHAH